jgi:hypothetical protein
MLQPLTTTILTLTLGIAGATGVGAMATIPACGFRVANAKYKK